MNTDIASPLAQVWDSFRSMAIFQTSWPDQGSIALLEAIRGFDQSDAEKLEGDFEFVSRFGSLPIIAVAGLLNAGKSSLVASFLSEVNRPRVARGLESRNGTHRFTLWMPASWKNGSPLLDGIKLRLASVFGHAAELLPDDSEEARKQQSAKDRITIPLLSFDAALDKAGVALFDCPDIERDGGDTVETNPRLAVLSKARDFCAGVIVVTRRERIESAIIDPILSVLPEVTRIVAVNFVRNESPDVVRDELVARLSKQPEFLYLAFDFAVQGYEQRTPVCDPNRNIPHERRETPFFFALGENNLPDAVTENRSLLRLSERISKEQLQQRSQREMRGKFVDDCRRLLDQTEKRTREASDRITRASEDLFETILRLRSGLGGGLKFKPDKEILERLKESIDRTSPFYLRLQLKAMKAAKGFGRGIMKVAKIVRHPIQTAKEGIKKMWETFDLAKAEEFARHVETDGNKYGTEFKAWAARSSPEYAAQFTGEVEAEAVLKRFNTEERTNLNDMEWDRLTAEFWKQTSKGKATASSLLAFFGMLGAFVWIVFEPVSGSGFLAKLLTGKLVLGVTGGEFLTALVGGVLAGSVAGVFLSKEIEEKIARLQISNLYAIAADRVGVPRKVPVKFSKFPEPQIAEKRNGDAWGVRHCRWQMMRVDSNGLNELRAAMDNLGA